MSASTASVGGRAGVGPARIVVVAGPTAVGKSALALRLAGALDGEIVSVDSVQVYHGADIGSAKPSPAERALIPHHGLDLWAPHEVGDMARFLRYAHSAIDDILRRGRRPIVVGGTGLYLTGLLHGLVDLPPADDALRRELEALDDEALGARLRAVDLTSAERIHPNDRVRLIRAIEGSERSGEPASVRRLRHAHRETLYHTLMLVPLRTRAELYARINARVTSMVRAGLVAETAAIVAKGGEARGVLGAIGYAQAAAALRGELEPANLEAAIAQATRRYAKRQMTYWRNEPAKRGWCIRPGADEPAIQLNQGREADEEGAAFRVLALESPHLADQVERWLLAPPPPAPEVATWYLSAADLKLD